MAGIPSFRPSFDHLEDRTVPTVFSVKGIALGGPQPEPPTRPIMRLDASLQVPAKILIGMLQPPVTPQGNQILIGMLRPGPLA